MKARRFPFAIYYRMEEGVVRVQAILDCRRDPKRIRRRLTRSPVGLWWTLTLNLAYMLALTYKR